MSVRTTGPLDKGMHVNLVCPECPETHERAVLDLVSSVVHSPYMASAELRCARCGAEQIATLVLTPKGLE